MKLQTNRINYDHVVNELIKGMRSEENEYVMPMMDRVEKLKEYRTIRFGGARQTGKSTWAVEQIVKDPENSVMFVKDVHLANALYNNWLERYGVESSPLVKERIITQKLLSDTTDSSSVIGSALNAPSLIIFDDAAYLLHFFKKHLYHWIADTAELDPTIILIN